MEAGVKNKIPYLICFICFILAQPVVLQRGNAAFNDKAVNSMSQDTGRITVSKSADWSKRIHPSRNDEYASHLAEESENIEVTSKAPRIVRKLRIQNGKRQNIEALKEINPESRSSEGGAKIVRIKKFKRKPPRKTTVVPDTTSRAFTPTPSTTDSMLTSSSPYSHITVINKEVRNPKKRKNKRKRPTNQYASTPSYDSESRLNGLKYTTPFPDVRHMSQQNVRSLNSPDSYSEYGGFYSERKHPVLNNEENKFISEEHFGNNHGLVRMNENNYGFKPEMSRMSHHLSTFKDVGQSDYQRNSMIMPKQSAPKPSFGLYSNDKVQQFKSSESRNVNMKNASSGQNKTENSSDKTSTENLSTTGDKTNAEIAIQRAGDSSTAVPPKFGERSVILKVKEETLNSSVTRGPETEAAINPGNGAVPEQDRNYEQEYRFASQYPSLFYNRKNAFSDPFFDTPDMPSTMQRQGMTQQVISPLNLPFSPFYASNNPQKEDSFFDRSSSPYHSEELILPGFHHSPELRSLRRSILDTYEDTTTLEPVTHFSLPKFEMPDIDFNDKGCQTVYKEVKTVPSEGSESRNNNAKSFVMTRECYFPDGLPTAKRAEEAESTTIPNTTKVSKE